MDLVVYSQYYRTRTPERQLEIDECLRRNLNHPGISRVVLFCESDAPPVPQGTVPVEVVTSDERITYAEWFRWVKRQGSGIGLLLNADIYLDEGLEHLAASFDTPEAFLALTRYNPGHAGFHLNDYPHWTQDVWGVRADAELPESLLYASSFPLGFPGCDNRIAYVLWSHGFHVRNPCYHVRSVHLQASTARAYDKTGDRLYGGVSYVHPSLAPDEDAELEFTLWTRSQQRPAGVLINQQAIEQGVHRLLHGETEVAQRFLDLQQFTGLSWMHEAVGSAHLQGDLHPYASEDTVFLPLAALLQQGVELQLLRPTRLEGLTLRLPRRAPIGYMLELEAHGEGDAQLLMQGEAALALSASGERRFWQPAELKGKPWQRLRLKLSGPADDPAWKAEEGAELVLFGEEGALNQVKSLNVIAEEKGENQPPRLLRTVRFAASEVIAPKNLKVQESAIEAADGCPGGDALTGSSDASAVKYAYNRYSTSETGSYTAALVLKAGTQSRVILRLNDQSGVNDARQAFDLERGCKEGEAVNGGSVTQPSSRIQALGGGWYRCSISGVFNEPVTCLHAPAVWLEHYAPSSSTGTVYTGEAQVFQGFEASGAADPPEKPLAPQLLPVADGACRYIWRRRKDCEAQLVAAEELYSYGNRFRVLRSADELIFDDRFWPNVGVLVIKEKAKEALAQGEEALFALGFLQPVQEWKPEQIASEKRYPNHQLFWQYPCRTEEDAFRVHRELVGPQLEGDSYQVYLGLPWATFIDRAVNKKLSDKGYPEPLLLANRKRIEALASVLSQWDKKLKVHTVCQHIFWLEAIPWIRSTGVTDLWISHKEKGFDYEQGLRLHSWSLYAVNDRDPARRQDLYFVPIEQRPVFASFSGAHMKHYLSDVRQRMTSLAELDGYRVTIKDMWHFNKVVYGFQVFADESKKNAIDNDEVRSYNDLLSHTRFSLCPVGAGPNTLRLWESLAVGAIPVVLSDRHELPALERLLPAEGLSWDQVVVLHPEAELDQLDARLKAINGAELHRRQRLCRLVYEASLAMTCFGRSKREVEPIPLMQELFKPQQVQVPGKTEAAFTGVSRMVPAALTLSPKGPSSIVVHLDQTEQLLGVRLTGLGCSLEEVSFSISRYREFNKFDELQLEPDPSAADGAWLWLPPGERWWAMGLKLTAEWKPGTEARPEAQLQLAVLSEKDAFAREARRLDRAGILKAASDRNAERQDDTFDTKHINSGLILERLPEVVRAEDVVPWDELFPPVAAPTTNLIGEPLGDGITMYVHLMNRNENVGKNLGNWLQQRFDELILLDWSSSDPVAAIPGVFNDARVRVVRVNGQTKFIRTLAQNLASRMARNQRIFKCDSDVEFKGDFFAAHPLEPGEFWVGDWHHARDNNERHLHGETYYFIQDFLGVSGYDERIKSYGQDDSNLKDRMVLAGLTKKVFVYDLIEHQHHEQTTRVQGSNGIHPMVATYANRVMTRTTPLWNYRIESTHFNGPSTSTRQLQQFDILESPPEATTSQHINTAVNTIGLWYIDPGSIKSMDYDQINSIIWDRQTE